MIRFALSQEQMSIVERLVATGRFEAPQNVIGAALSLLESRERERLDCLAALHAALTCEDAGSAAGATKQVAAPSLRDDPQPFDADALDEIERLIASRAVAGEKADALA